MTESQHEHSIGGSSEHPHTHGVVDPTILNSKRGIWAVKWSFAGLMITALLQVIIVFYTGSFSSDRRARARRS